MAAEQIESISLELDNKIKSKKKRNIKFLFSLIILVAIIYSIGWFIVTDKTQKAVSTALQAFNQQGNQVVCENIHKASFPMRIGIACDSFSLHINRQNNEQNISVSSKAIKAQVPIYAPSSLELQLQAPLQLQLPNLAPIYAKWHDMNVEFDISQKIPKYVRLQANQLAIGNQDIIAQNKTANLKATPKNQTPNDETPKNQIWADSFNIEATNLDTDVNANIIFKALQLPFIIPQELTSIPALDGQIVFTIENSKDLISRNNTAINMHLMRGKKGVINNANIILATGGHLIVSGPFSFDEAGYLDAEFKIAIGDQIATLQTANLLFPSQQKNIKMIFFGLNAMNKDSNGNPEIILKINKGEMRISFFKFGQIRPI